MLDINAIRKLIDAIARRCGEDCMITLFSDGSGKVCTYDDGQLLCFDGLGELASALDDVPNMVCTCGHTGGEGLTQHQAKHTFKEGFGKCIVPGCNCQAFIFDHAIDNRKPWEFDKCKIEPIRTEKPVYFGTPRGLYFTRMWKITFPDKTWVKCATKKECRRYIIDRLI